MTKQEAIDELHKHYVPEYVNYIVTALTDGATPSDAPTINAIPIPEDATNGDVIKIMFPNSEVITLADGTVSVKYKEHGCWVHYESDWWNAKYKEG